MIDRVRCRVRVMVRTKVRFRVRTQETPGTDPTAEQVLTRRAECSTQGGCRSGSAYEFQGPTNVCVTLRVGLKNLLVQLQSSFGMTW